MRVIRDETRKACGERSKALYANPEFKAAVSAAISKANAERWADPVMRQKMIDGAAKVRYPQPDNSVKLPPDTFDP